MKKKKYERLIYLASKLEVFRERECYLDFFGYSIEREENTFKIQDDNENLEKGMRLGYSIFSEQRYVFQMQYLNDPTNNLITIDKLVKELDIEELIIKTGKGKRERFSFQFNGDLLTLFSKIKFYDHSLELEHIGKEWNLSKKELKTKSIVGNATLNDILAFTFIFKLLSKIVIAYIEKNKKLKNKDILGMGELWIFEEQFFAMMDYFMDKDKSEAVLDILTLDVHKNVVDLFYTPIFREKNRIGIYVSLFSSSNILRNIIQNSFINQNKAVTNNDGVDGLSNKVYESFNKNKNFEVLKNVEYRINKGQKEIDVLVISEEYLYIIECKNALFPSNSYETRTSIDHLLKAKTQLNQHIEAFNNETVKRNIETKLNIRIPQKIKTIIVMGNRLFVGNKNFEHPIRTYWELDKF